MRLEPGGQKASLGHHPRLQLDADEGVDGDIVTPGTVSVLVD